MFNADFDPYDMLVSCHNQINHMENTIQKLIKHINNQEILIADLAEGHANLASLHQRNTTVIKTIIGELQELKNNASN